MTKTVMVVDDDIPNLTVMGLLLKKIGYSAITIHNGWDALAAIKEKKPDLILLDLMMTPIDGWQFLDELRKEGLSNGKKGYPGFLSCSSLQNIFVMRR